MTILVTTDFSSASRAAFKVAAHLAHVMNEPLHIAHVLMHTGDHDIWGSTMTVDERRTLKTDVVDALWELVAQALGAQPRPEIEVVALEGYVIEALLKYADDIDAHLIVCGASGRGDIGQRVFGSTASQLIRESIRAVVTVPADVTLTDQGFGNILAPVDRTPCSSTSLLLAATLARRLESKVCVLHALPEPSPELRDANIELTGSDVPDALPEHELGEALVQFVHDADIEDVTQSIKLGFGRPAEVILKTIEEDQYHIICIGTHGHRGFRRFMLGSTAERLLRRSPCVIVTLRDISLDPNASQP